MYQNDFSYAIASATSSAGIKPNHVSQADTALVKTSISSSLVKSLDIETTIDCHW